MVTQITHAPLALPSDARAAERERRTPRPAGGLIRSNLKSQVATRKRRRADTVRCSRRALCRSLLPELSVCPPARLPQSDAVIAPCCCGQGAFPLPSPSVLSGCLSRWQCGCGVPNAALHPSASIAEEDEMFFPLSPVPLPPSEHHPVLHLPHRR